MNPLPPIDEREWLAQERAMHGRAAAAGHDDPMVAAYRPVAAAARQAREPDLPGDFAARVAARVSYEPRAAPDGRLEHVLLRILLGLMPVALAAVVALFGARWWQASTALLGEDAVRWALVATACAALSWGMDRLRAGGAGAGGNGGHAPA